MHLRLQVYVKTYAPFTKYRKRVEGGEMNFHAISPSHQLKFTVWLTPLNLANSTPYLLFYSKRGVFYDIIEVVGKTAKVSQIFHVYRIPPARSTVWDITSYNMSVCMLISIFNMINTLPSVTLIFCLGYLRVNRIKQHKIQDMHSIRSSLTNHPSNHPSTHPTIHPPIHPTIHPSMVSTYLPTYLSIYLSI